MAASRLDQAVKGAAPPGTSVPSAVSRMPAASTHRERRGDRLSGKNGGRTADPTAILPSSPPQIYLNLLILEASLRSQYLTLRARRRQNIFFLFLLGLWNTFFFYALFLQPREDGRGIGGSVYWVVETTEKVALMGGVVTGILVWGTGQWERGVRWPRRFVGVTNRGLRAVNCKIIVMKGPWWKETLGYLAFIFPYSSFYATQSTFHHVDASLEEEGDDQSQKHGQDEESGTVREEDLAQGGNTVKLLLLPKPFSPDFRENWEMYRSEYWEKENERRAAILQRLRRQERQRAKEKGGLLWWLGLSGWGKPTSRDVDVEKPMPARLTPEIDMKRFSIRRGESHSRNTSRSSTPGVDTDERPASRGSRRNSGNFTEGRRRPRGSSSSSGGVAASRQTSGQPRMPKITARVSPLMRGNSGFGSSSGNETDLVGRFS